jgi:hypothetical protein
MRRFALSVARLIGLAFAMYGAWILLGTLASVIAGGSYDPTWVPWLVMGVCLAGLLGSVTLLLSIDGPARWRNRTRRALGWLGLMILAVLPTQAILVMFPLGLLGAFTLFLSVESRSDRGRHLLKSV